MNDQRDVLSRPKQVKEKAEQVDRFQKMNIGVYERVDKNVSTRTRKNTEKL